MTLNLEQLILAYPHNFWVDFSSEALQKALPKENDYSHDSAAFRALLNQLCINVLVPEITQEFETEYKQDSHTKTNYTTQSNLLASESLPSIWEVVTGTKVIIQETQIVIIPNVWIDTEEFSVPQEWVDIPQWRGDYYVAVQVNLDDRWLRIWGVTTFNKLKTEGRYDPSDRTYSLDSEDLFEHTNVLFLDHLFSPEPKIDIPALPELLSNQVDNLLMQTRRFKSYSPRLQVAFKQWAALLENDDYRQKMYRDRVTKTMPIIVDDFVKNRVSQLQDKVEEIAKQKLETAEESVRVILKDKSIEEIIAKLEEVYRNYDSSDWWDEGGKALAGSFAGGAGNLREGSLKSNVRDAGDAGEVEIELRDFAEELLEELAEIWDSDAT